MQRKGDNMMRGRLKLVALFFGVVAFIVLALKILHLQTVKYEEYQKKAIEQQTRDKTVAPVRGTIYDRNMKPLAISANTEMVTLEAVKIDNEEQGLLIADTLSKLLELDYDSVLKKVQEKATYTIIKKGVEKDVADLIRSFVKEHKLDSIYMVADSTRYYPFGSFLSHTLGFVGSDSQGLYGLEAYYDDVLSGTPGRIIRATNARGEEMPFQYEMYYPAQNGNNLVLTIDEVIQHYLEKNLEMAYADNKVAEHVTGIIMDVNTGAILAMSNKPDFDLNDPFTLVNKQLAAEITAMPEGDEKKAARSTALSQQWLNRAVTYTYYPGSTFKIVTSAMALEENAVSTSTSFYCPGYKQVSDRRISCWKTAGHGAETFVDAIKNSCNPAFMEIGARVGRDNFYKYYRGFGLNAKTGIDLPGESIGFIWAQGDMSEVDLAVASFGQNFTITPLQLITAVAAVANGGNLVTPHLVSEITDEHGNILKTVEQSVKRQVISQKTSDLLCDILEDVVTTGTGKNAYVMGYRVAGKTGTTEKIEKQIATGQTGLRISSFVAFAPADDPQVALLILLDEPNVYPVTGGITVAPVIRRVMEEVLPYLEVEPLYTEEEQQKKDTVVPNLDGLTLAQAKTAINAAGLKYRTVGSGDTVTDQIPAYAAVVSRSSEVVLYMGGEKPASLVTVPDLTGMSVQTARSALANLGLFYRSSSTEFTQGNVAVRRQSIQAGTGVAAGTVIEIEFTDLNQTSQ